MKKKNLYMQPIVLAVFLAACAIVRTQIPMTVLPEYCLAAESRNDIIVTLRLSALTFGLLLFVSGFPWLDCLKQAAVCGIVTPAAAQSGSRSTVFTLAEYCDIL